MSCVNIFSPPHGVRFHMCKQETEPGQGVVVFFSHSCSCMSGFAGKRWKAAFFQKKSLLRQLVFLEQLRKCWKTAEFYIVHINKYEACATKKLRHFLEHSSSHILNSFTIVRKMNEDYSSVVCNICHFVVDNICGPKGGKQLLLTTL